MLPHPNYATLFFESQLYIFDNITQQSTMTSKYTGGGSGGSGGVVVVVWWW